MDSLEIIAKGLAEHPTAWLLAIALIVIGYLYKENSASKKELVDMISRKEAEHRETISKIVPICEKATDAVEVLERITDSLIKGQS